MTHRQLAGKVERLRRELELLNRNEGGSNIAAIDRVSNDLAEAEFALAEIQSRQKEVNASR